MKEVEKKDAPEVSGGYIGPAGCTDLPGYPVPEYPQYPNGEPDDPTGEGDLPVGMRG